MIKKENIRNLLLSSLSDSEFDFVGPYLRMASLPPNAVLQKQDQRITSIYFIEYGYASMIVRLTDGSAIEVGVVGPEGMVGIPILYESDRSLVEAIVHAESVALYIAVIDFKKVWPILPGLKLLLSRYAMAYGIQITMTAVCNGRHSIEQRLARWLLTVSQRIQSNEIPMTHEYLSTMLGVRRASISGVAAKLQAAGLIHYERGRMTILDQTGLQAAACECGHTVNREYMRLLGGPECGIIS